jgi:hypothetical protein
LKNSHSLASTVAGRFLSHFSPGRLRPGGQDQDAISCHCSVDNPDAAWMLLPLAMAERGATLGPFPDTGFFVRRVLRQQAFAVITD